MNKSELIEIIAEKAKVTKVQATAIIDSFIDTISETLKGGEKVTLVGFGTFSVSKRTLRNARSPQTGLLINIEEKKVAKFKAGKQLLIELQSSNR